MKKRITERQMSILESMCEKTFAFPDGRSVRSCESLEMEGLLDSELKLKQRDFAKGTARFARAYRLTEAGANLIAKKTGMFS